MVSANQTANVECSIEFFDIPSPGDPPKSDPWWRFRRQTPNVILSKSEERVRWGWANYARYKRLFVQTNVLTGSLKEMEDSLLVEHQRYLDRLEKAMEEESGVKNGINAHTAHRIATSAKQFQKRSKRFTDTALSEVHARAAGRTHYPLSGAPQSNISANQTRSEDDLSLPKLFKSEELPRHRRCQKGTQGGANRASNNVSRKNTAVRKNAAARKYGMK